MTTQVTAVVTLFALAFLFPPVARAGEVDKLKKEIEALKKQIRALEDIVEGSARPINLGRTSLARVNASTVNGHREQDNIFYGVANAFDDGSNWHNNINYTYWLSDSEPAPWIEIRFDHAVSVKSVQLQGGQAFSALLSFAKGGEMLHNSRGTELLFETPTHGVTRLKLTFGENALQGNVRVDEVRVLGYVLPGVKYEVSRPRVK